MPIDDPDALYDDETARSAVLDEAWIATQPGALAEARPALQPNDIYGTHLRLIFYDEAIFGHYQSRFDRIFAEPRYTDLAANLAYFSQVYGAILAKRLPPGAHGDRAAFYQRYHDTIVRANARLDVIRARLSGVSG